MIQLNHEPWCYCGECGNGVRDGYFSKHPKDYNEQDKGWLNMPVTANKSIRSYCDTKRAQGIECDCRTCQRDRGIPDPVEYVFGQELMDEHNKMKEDIKFLLSRIKFLESGEGF